MLADADIEAALLEHDGMCREVNFIGPNWDGLLAFLREVSGDFGNVSVGSTTYDTDQEAVSDVAMALDLVRRSGGMAQLLFREGRGFVSFLQIFVERDPDTLLPQIELTFFPQDIRATQHIARDFLAWADTGQRLSGSSGYYARYENVSWKFGDEGPSSGVFLVRKE